MKDSKKIKDLLVIKKKINQLIKGKINILDFDKFITLKNANISILSKEYNAKTEEILSELISELELLRTKFLESIDWIHNRKNQEEYSNIRYSNEFLLKIKRKINKEISSLKNN